MLQQWYDYGNDFEWQPKSTWLQNFSWGLVFIDTFLNCRLPRSHNFNALKLFPLLISILCCDSVSHMKWDFAGNSFNSSPSRIFAVKLNERHAGWLKAQSENYTIWKDVGCDTCNLNANFAFGKIFTWQPAWILFLWGALNEKRWIFTKTAINFLCPSSFTINNRWTRDHFYHYNKNYGLFPSSFLPNVLLKHFSFLLLQYQSCNKNEL